MSLIKKGAFDINHVRVDVSEREFTKIREIRRWCLLNIAENDGTLYHCRKYAWTIEYFPMYINFTFDRETDAMMFALKWA